MFKGNTPDLGGEGRGSHLLENEVYTSIEVYYPSGTLNG